MEDFSVLLPVYRTEENAMNVIEELTSKEIECLKKIIVIVDEGTIDIERSKVKVVENEERIGKSAAVNQALSLSNTEVNVLLSSDIIINQETVLEMVRNTSRETLVTPRVEPLKSGGKASQIANKIWDYHHSVSKEQPKAGEAIAFKGKKSIPERTIADEEFISARNENTIYLENHLVYNKPPSSVKQLYKQRKRVFAGHLQLIRSENHLAPSAKISLLIETLKKDLSRNQDYLTVFQTTALELAARFDAILHMAVGKISHKWEIIETSERGKLTGKRI